MNFHKILGVIIFIFSLISFVFALCVLLPGRISLGELELSPDPSYSYRSSDGLFVLFPGFLTILAVISLVTGFSGVMIAKSRRWAFILYSATVVGGVLATLILDLLSKKRTLLLYPSLTYPPSMILMLPLVFLLLPTMLLRPHPQKLTNTILQTKSE